MGDVGLNFLQMGMKVTLRFFCLPSKCCSYSNRKVLASHPPSSAFLKAQTVHLLPACHLGRVTFPFLSSWSFLPEQFLVCVELPSCIPKKGTISGLLLLALFLSWLAFGCAPLVAGALGPVLELLSLHILCVVPRTDLWIRLQCMGAQKWGATVLLNGFSPKSVCNKQLKDGRPSE